MNIERRLQRISEALNKGHTLLRDMTDDELAQVITGDPRTKASDLTTEYLESVARGRLMRIEHRLQYLELKWVKEKPGCNVTLFIVVPEDRKNEVFDSDSYRPASVEIEIFLKKLKDGGTVPGLQRLLRYRLVTRRIRESHD